MLEIGAVSDLGCKGIGEVVSGIEQMVEGGKRFKEIMTGLKESLMKLGTDAFVTRPLNRFLDQQVGSAGLLDQVKGGSDSVALPRARLLRRPRIRSRSRSGSAAARSLA